MAVTVEVGHEPFDVQPGTALEAPLEDGGILVWIVKTGSLDVGSFAGGETGCTRMSECTGVWETNCHSPMYV